MKMRRYVVTMIVESDPLRNIASLATQALFDNGVKVLDVEAVMIADPWIANYTQEKPK